MSELEDDVFSDLGELEPSEEVLDDQEADRTERILGGLFHAAGMGAEAPRADRSPVLSTNGDVLADTAIVEQERRPRVVSLLVDGRPVTSAMLGLQSANDLDFLEMLPDFSGREDFRRADVMERGFHRKGSDSARQQAFLVTRTRVSKALETFLGRPAMGQQGAKTKRRYWLLADVTRPPEDASVPAVGLVEEQIEDQLPPPIAARIPEELKPETQLPIAEDADPLPEVEKPSPAKLVNGGLTRAFERRREEAQAAATEGAALKDAVRPHIESMIDTRHAGQAVKNTGRRGHLMGVLDNRSRVLSMYWGIANGQGPVEAKDFEEIARDSGMTPYTARTLVREALKDIIRSSEGPRDPNPLAAKAARGYLEFIDSL